MEIELSGVECNSYPDCMAVGRWNVGEAQGGLALKWDGNSWSAATTPIPGGALASDLSDLSCSSDTACIAVGTYTDAGEIDKPLSVGWDGEEWTLISTPVPSGATESGLSDISCQASGACLAVGSYLDEEGARHNLAMSRSSSWELTSAPAVSGAAEERLSGLACPSASLCVAVGSAEIGGEQVTQVQRWDGSSWDEPLGGGAPFASHGSRLSSVSCLESGRCTAVGSVQYTDYTEPENLAYALEGEELALTEWGEGFARSWVRKRVSPSTSVLTDVACVSSTCIEVGHDTDPAGVRHAQATTWSSAGEAPPSPVSVPEPAGASASELSGLSCTSASSCVAVGSYLDSGTTKTLVTSWNGSAWSVVSSPNPSGATASRLNGVSCATSSLCLAAGSYVSGGKKRTLALKWNGSAWSVVSSPHPAGALSSQLADLSCASSTSCIGVGHYTDSAGVQKTLAVSWNDGTQSWGAVASPNPSGAEASRLSDVFCSASSSCFAVGDWSDEDEVQTAFGLKWNGSEWSTVSLPLPSTASASRLAGISCVSGSDCTAIGTYAEGSEELALALRWNGTAWSSSAVDPVDGAAAERPVAISCAGESCHASGSVLFPGFRARNLAYHFDGTDWEVVERGGLGGELRGISCVREDGEAEEEEAEEQCVVAGELRLDPTQGDDARSPVNWQLSEEQWSAFPATSAGDEWADVSCTSLDECMIVGNAAGSPVTTRALRWNGSSWADTSPANKSGALTNFLESVSCFKASRCTAVGYYRPDNTTPEKLLPMAQSWNGTSWTLETVPAPTVSGTSRAKLADVSCVAADFCLAVGSYLDAGQSHGLIERWNGSSWSLETIAAPAESTGFALAGVSCTSRSRCVAVGSYEESESKSSYMTEWNGVSWSASSHPAPDPSYLTDVACLSSSECVAVGSHVIGWNGENWSAEPAAKPAAGGAYHLDSVSCDGAGGCIASGYQFALDAPDVREPLALVAFGALESSIDDLPAEEDADLGIPERNWSAEEIWPSTSELIDVACPSSSNCVGVGKYTDVEGKVVSQALSWDGSTWSERGVPVPSGATESALEGVSCTSTSSCVVVGSYTDAEEVTKTLAMKWNGSAWSIVSSPNPAGAEISKLADIHCASSSSCIAVGGYLDPTEEQGRSLVLGWDGSEWKDVSVPNLDDALGSELTGVWCASTTACMAVGMTVDEEGLRRNLALSLSESTWSLLDVPSSVGNNRLADVHCTSATACVAVGDHLLASGKAQTLAMRWNGESWATEETPSPGPYLNSLSGVSCPSANQCNAVGMSSNGSSDEPLALEWEGGSWSVRETESLSSESAADVFRVSLGGVACVSSSQCMAVGAVETQNSGSPESEEQPNRNVAYSFDGTDWALAQFAGPPVSSIGGVSCPASAPTACMAVGRSDDLADAHGAVDTAWKLEEGKWAPLPMPGDVWSSLEDLSCSAADKCTAVGSSDAGQFVVVRWNGTEWSTQTAPTPGSGYGHALSGVSCASASSCVAVGSSQSSAEDSVPRAIAWNGSSWSSMTISPPGGAESASLADVACDSSTSCKAVGSYRDEGGETHAFAARWNGSTWTIDTIANPFESLEARLSGVTCVSASDCFAVGSYRLSEAEDSRRSLAMRWNGSAWTVQTVAHPEEGSADRTELRDVSCITSTQCVAVGETTAGESDYSLAMAWDGSEWSVEAGFLPNGTATPQLTSVSCGTEDGCVAGGWSHDGTEALVVRAGSEFDDEVASFSRESTYIAGGPSAEIAKATKCREKGFKKVKGKYGLKEKAYGIGWKAWSITNWCYGQGHVYWWEREKKTDYHHVGLLIRPTYVFLDWWTIRCNDFNGYFNHNCLSRLLVSAAFNAGCTRGDCEGDVEFHCIHIRVYGSEGTPQKPNHNRDSEPEQCPGSQTRLASHAPSNPPPGTGDDPEVEEPPPAPTPPPIDPAKDSDVNGDDKADLVTLHTSGDIHTLNGANGADKVTSGMDSALFRGNDENVVDVSDVDADGYADLVSLCFTDQVCVRQGQSDNSFDTGSIVRTDVPSGLRAPKGHEPIGVADVTGDLRGDLVTFYAPEGNFYVYPGEEFALFGEGVTLGGENLDSALFDRHGLYFLDVANVNGDDYADVVALDTAGVAQVFPGTDEGVQQASVHLNPAIDPIMADGVGHEPVGVGDVDGDGKADLATLTPSGQIAVFAGTSKKFAPNNELRYLEAEPVLSHSALDSSLTDEVGDDFVGLMDRTGDGKADLVKVSSEGAVSIASGQADLKFGSFGSFATGVLPNRFAKVGYEQLFEKPFIRRIGCSPAGCVDRPSPVESDVDGDLRADLVTLDTPEAVHVYRAMGDRGHAVSAGPGIPPYDTPNYVPDSALFDGTGHHVIDIADVDGDWQADMVTLHDNGNVYVFRANVNANGQFNPGTASLAGSMKPGTHLASGFEPIAVADVTGDALGDLVVFKDGQGVRLYPGSAGGTFGAPVTSLAGANSARFDQSGYHFLDLVDVTGDQHGDLVASSAEDDEIVVFKGNSNGRFILDGVSSLPLRLDEGSGQELVGLGDVNGDHRADLATLVAGTVNVYEGQASGGFATKKTGSFTPAGTSFAGAMNSNLFDQSGDEIVGLLDENGDRKADLVTVRSDESVRIYLGKANFAFNTTPTVRSIPEFSPIRFDEPSGHEVVGEKPPALRAGCIPSDCPWPPIPFEPVQSDVDADYRGDLVSASADGDAQIFAGARGGFRIDPITSLPGDLDSALRDGKGHYLIDVADVDDDGHSDLVTVKDDGKVLVHRGEEDRSFDEALETGGLTLAPTMSEAGNYEPIGVADVTGDGFDDLVVQLGPGNGSLKLYKGLENGKFSTTAVTSHSSSSNANSALTDAVGNYYLDLADVNGDERADLVSVASWGTATVLPGNADGTFATAVSAASIDTALNDGSGHEPIGVAEMSGDAYADLLTLDGSGNLKLWAGKADGSFAAAASAYGEAIDSSLKDGTGQELVGLVDFNSDGLADLVALEDGDLLAYRMAEGSFEEPILQEGDISTLRGAAEGQEFVAERVLLRRLGCTAGGCPWPPALPGDPVDGDLDGDHRADLVTLARDGTAYLRRGTATGIDADDPIHSAGLLDPSLLDGKGHFAVDLADVNGDHRSDLITYTGSDRIARVHKGRFNGTLQKDAGTTSIALPGPHSEGGIEPIAVADVNGDTHADLIAHVPMPSAVTHLTPGYLTTRLGNSSSQFTGGSVTSLPKTDSALRDGKGHYFLDAIDLSGDGRAELVSVAGGEVKAFEANSDGSFDAPSTLAELNPVMDDGDGSEPIGLGDVEGDGKADLLTLHGKTLKLYSALGEGVEEPTVAYAGEVNSSLTDGKGLDLVGLLDHDGDGRSDLVAIESDGDVLSFEAKADGTFAAPTTSAGPLSSVRFDKSGQEPVSEKAFLRRAGCGPEGCGWEHARPAGWAPIQLDPAAVTRRDTWCASEYECVVVGETAGHGGERRATLRQANNGPEAPSWASEGEATLAGIDCTEISDCIAVGSSAGGEGEEALIVEWNGETGSEVEAPAPAGATQTSLTEISCASASACVAVGSYLDATETERTLALKYNGSSWSVLSTPGTGSISLAPSGSVSALSSRLAGVSCTGASACTAVGSYLESGSEIRKPIAMAWNGTAWTAHQTPGMEGAEPGALAAVDCPSAGSCLAVGHSGIKGELQTVALQGEGSTWSAQETPAAIASDSLADVSCASASSCLAVGSSLSGTARAPLALHFDGSEWSSAAPELTPSLSAVSLNAVSCPESGCGAVGRIDYGPYAKRALTLLSEGPAQTLAPSEYEGLPGDSQLAGDGLTSLSCVDLEDCHAIGTALSFAHEGTTAGIWGLDGSQWSFAPGAEVEIPALRDISCGSGGECIAVGNEKSEGWGDELLIERLDGEDWETETPKSPPGGYSSTSFEGVSGSMAVGWYWDTTPNPDRKMPLAESYGEGGWSLLTVPTPSGSPYATELRDVECTSWSNCLAVGFYRATSGAKDFALIAHWNGSSWSLQSISAPSGATTTSLQGISCTSSSQCTTVGSYSTGSGSIPLVYRYNGSSWSLQTANKPSGATSAELLEVSCYGSSACIAVGTSTAATNGPAVALLWNGSTWTSEAQPTLPEGASARLEAVECSAQANCLAVGRTEYEGGYSVPLAVER